MKAIVVAALALLLPQNPERLTWVPNPRTTSGSWVSDPAGHLQPPTVAALDSIISALESETTAEMAVVVLDSLDGLEPADAALALHRRWGVGKASRDNGILFLWSPKLRRTHVSIGYGLEGVLTDARTGRIQDEHVLPFFRDGDFDAGVIAGVRALAAAARGETYSGLPRVAAGRPGGGERRRGPPESVLWLLAAGAATPILWALAVGYRRRRPRNCPRGHGKMRRLSESDDDEKLGREALLEEQLESMDYDVWVCGQCDEHLVLPYKRLSFKYSECPECKRRTCETKTKTVRSATRSSTGLRRITRTCRNCRFTDTRDEVIPIITSSSSGGGGGGSGGGGGGSSFGGGSAGGGGAGRSY